MSKSTITIDKAKEDVSLDLHFIPCHLKEDNDAAVSTFFKPSIKDHPGLDNVKTASFRGRPLLGTKVKVLKGYEGGVLDNCEGDSESKQFMVNKKFRSLQLWNWDQIPSKDDKIVRAMDWCAIAEAIHKPVDVHSTGESGKISPRKSPQKQAKK